MNLLDAVNKIQEFLKQYGKIQIKCDVCVDDKTPKQENEIKQLEAKVALYEKALDLYASYLNKNCDSGVIDFVCEDGGQAARQSLEQGKG